MTALKLVRPPLRFTRRKQQRMRIQKNRLKRELYTRDPRAHFIDRKGRRINLFRWAALFERMSYRQVAHTYVNEDVHVSTIWLGHGPELMGDTYESAIINERASKRQRIEVVGQYVSERDAFAAHLVLVREQQIRARLRLLQQPSADA